MTDRYFNSVDFGGGSSGGITAGGVYQIYNKATNNQPAVFTALTGTGSRDEYFAANPAELDTINNEAFAVGIGTTAEDPSTVPDSGWYAYVNGAWSNIIVTLAGATGSPGQDGQDGQDGQADLTNLTNGRVPYNDNGTLRDSPLRRMSDGTAFIQGVTRIEAGTLAMGPFVQLSERGGFVGITNAFGDEFTFVDYRTPQNAASSRPRLLEYTEAENNFEIQTIQTESLNSPVTFNYTPTLLARTNSLIGQVGTAVTNLRFRIANSADVTQVLKYWPSEAAWLDGTGQDFNAGQMTIDFGDTELPLNQNTTLQIDIRYDSGTLLGDTNGVPALTAVLQRGQFTDLAYLTDVPTLLTAQQTADLLETLSGDDRLDASAVKNLPSGGSADGVVDTSSMAVDSNNNVTLTLGRTESLGQLTASFQLIAGNNVTLTPSVADGTITIASTGGGTTPTPVSTDLRYGLSSANDPALVDFAALTDEANPTDPITVSTGTTTAGQYFHIFTSNTHEIVRITDTVLQQDVYVRGGSGNIFTLTEDSRTEGSVTYDALTIGPLNAGVDEEYVVRFS